MRFGSPLCTSIGLGQQRHAQRGPDGKVQMSKEAGRRIKAAVVSYLMGYKGVDRTLKEMADEDPGEYWSDLAEKLLRRTNAEVVEGLFRPKKDTDETIQ